MYSDFSVRPTLFELGDSSPLSALPLEREVSGAFSTLEERTENVYKDSQKKTDDAYLDFISGLDSSINFNSLPKSSEVIVFEDHPPCGDESILSQVESVLESSPVFNSMQASSLTVTPDLSFSLSSSLSSSLQKAPVLQKSLETLGEVSINCFQVPKCAHCEKFKYEDIKNAMLSFCKTTIFKKEICQKYPFGESILDIYILALRNYFDLTDKNSKKVVRKNKVNPHYLSDLIEHFKNNPELIIGLKDRTSAKKKGSLKRKAQSREGAGAIPSKP